MANFYAIVRTTNGAEYTTGQVVSYTTVQPNPVPAGCKVVNLGEQGAAIDFKAKVWDPATEALVPVV